MRASRRALGAIVLLALCIRPAAAQDIRIQGRVNCPFRDSSAEEEDVRRAQYVVVFPGGLGRLAAITDQRGYFRLTLPRKDILDTEIRLFCLGKWGLDQATETLFVSDDIIVGGEINLPEPIKTKYRCEEMEFDILRAESALVNLKAGKVVDLTDEKVPRAEASPKGSGILKAGASGAGGVLAVILGLGVLAGPESPFPDADAKFRDNYPLKAGWVSGKSVLDGRPLDLAFSACSQNVGFNFAPTRNFNECAFWNMSSLLLSSQSQISLATNWKDYVRLSSILKKSDVFGAGFGLIAYFPSDERTVQLHNLEKKCEINTFEMVASLGFALKAKENIYLSLSPKLFYQEIDIPASIDKVTYYKEGEPLGSDLELVSTQKRISKLDFDFGTTAKLMRNLRLGISLGNLLRAKLQSERAGLVHQRFLGIGATYLWRRLNFGVEARLNEARMGEYALGINYIPWNKWMFHLGYCSRANLFSAGMSFGNLLLTVNHNDDRGLSLILGSRLSF